MKQSNVIIVDRRVKKQSIRSEVGLHKVRQFLGGIFMYCSVKIECRLRMLVESTNFYNLLRFLPKTVKTVES